MSSKQDDNFEKKMAEETAKGENANDMGMVINVKRTPIQFPNETWEEIIMWCKRLELGEHVSLANDRLFCISYQFMHEEKLHPLPDIRIYGNNHKPWMQIQYHNRSIKNLSKSEVPTVEVIENILAGNKLIIRNLDNDVLEFLRLLAPIFSAVNLRFVRSKFLITNSEIRELFALFTGKIQGLFIESKFTIYEFCKYYPVFLKDLIYMSINDYHIGEQEINALKNWLYERREDEKPKIVAFWSLGYRKFYEEIREDFLTTTKQTSFFIKIQLGHIAEGFPCNIVNLTTNERLRIQPSKDGWLIARLPRDCPNTPQQMFFNLRASIRRLSIVKILLYQMDDAKNLELISFYKCYIAFIEFFFVI